MRKIASEVSPYSLRAVPPDSAKQLAERLRQHGLQVQYRHHADLTHGGVLTESFEQTLPEAAK